MIEHLHAFKFNDNLVYVLFILLTVILSFIILHLFLIYLTSFLNPILIAIKIIGIVFRNKILTLGFKFWLDRNNYVYALIEEERKYFGYAFTNREYAIKYILDNPSRYNPLYYKIVKKENLPKFVGVIK